MNNLPKFSLSPLDGEQFGFPVGRARLSDPGDLPEILEAARRAGARLLVARCSADDYPSAQALERAGFYLVDTLLNYYRNLLRPPLSPPDPRFEILTAGPGDEETVAELARLSFADYRGHYGEDPRLRGFSPGRIYASWAVNALRGRDGKGAVFLVKKGGRLGGFLTMKEINPQLAEGVLAGALPDLAWRGPAMRELCWAGLRWAKALGYPRLRTGALISNLPMHRILTQVGLQVQEAEYTFHGWREDGAFSVRPARNEEDTR